VSASPMRRITVLGRSFSRGVVAVMVVAAATLIGLGVMATTGSSGAANAYCYSDSSVSSTGIGITVSGTVNTPAQVRNALAACTTMWKDGALTGSIVASAPGLDVGLSSGTPSTPTLPALVACVLGSGAIGIFPGDASTCHGNGYASAA